MATTLPPEIEAEFERLYCHTPTASTEIAAWLLTHGIKLIPGNHAGKHGLMRYGSKSFGAQAERIATRRLAYAGRPPDNPVRKPTPEERAARRVPLGGYRMMGGKA